MSEFAQSVRAGDHGVTVIARLLAPALDEALVGVAERPQTALLPVYDWKKAVRIDERLRNSWLSNDTVLWLLNYRSSVDLNRRMNEGLPSWQSLTPAIMGVVFWKPIGAAIGYDISLLSETLQIELSNSTKVLSEAEVEHFYDTNIFPAYLGDNSPFYIHRRVDNTNLADEAEPR